MKKLILISFLCGLILPVLFMAFAMHWQEENLPQLAAVEEQEETQAAVQEEQILVQAADGSVQSMDMGEYLTCVVLAEMPVDFHEEALKAQAVVARTYAMKRLENGSKHDSGAVCMEASCCQGYRSVEAFLADGGTQESVDKVSEAVESTAGQVLTYDGSLIDATYFSCSGGSTEAAVAVWGTDVPYLQVVESPGEEEATHYTDEVRFTAEEFADALGFSNDGDPGDWFGDVTYTDGGGVETMEICGDEYEGTDLRLLLGLRSTVFEVEVDADEIVIVTHGFGHRVGMSQYGAQAMAEEGSTYEEILAHYYQGTVLETR